MIELKEILSNPHQLDICMLKLNLFMLNMIPLFFVVVRSLANQISPLIQYVRLGFLVTSATQSVHTPGMECNVGPNVTVPILTATRLLDAKTRVRYFTLLIIYITFEMSEGKYSTFKLIMSKYPLLRLTTSTYKIFCHLNDNNVCSPSTKTI